MYNLTDVQKQALAQMIIDFKKFWHNTDPNTDAALAADLINDLIDLVTDLEKSDA